MAAHKDSKSVVERVSDQISRPVKDALLRNGTFATAVGAFRRHDLPAKVLPETDILDLSDRQIYPSGDELTTSFLVQDEPLLDKTTLVGSMGSCFAREIKDWLIEHGYSYLQTSVEPAARHGSAAWERVYNTFSMRQEFERALADFTPATRAWPTQDGQLASPYRKGIIWSDSDEMERELKAHERDARTALVTAEVFVITLGLTEIWFDKMDGSTFFQVPPPWVFDPDRHAFRTSTHAENLDNLRMIGSLLGKANPNCTLVVTVSPVPLRATFNKAETVLTANSRSKATLVSAARDFVDEMPQARYFPSYEVVTTVTRDPFEADNRHVRRSTVDQIMELFEASHACNG